MVLTARVLLSYTYPVVLSITGFVYQTRLHRRFEYKIKSDPLVITETDGKAERG